MMPYDPKPKKFARKIIKGIKSPGFLQNILKKISTPKSSFPQRNGNFLKFLNALTDLEDLLETNQNSRSLQKTSITTINNIRNLMYSMLDNKNFEAEFGEWAKTLNEKIALIKTNNSKKALINSLSDYLHDIESRLESNT